MLLDCNILAVGKLKGPSCASRYVQDTALRSSLETVPKLHDCNQKAYSFRVEDLTGM